MQPFDTLAVDEHDFDDRRHLPHQPQDVEPVLLVAACSPRQLHGPLQLVGDVVEKRLDLAGARARFGAQPLAQHHPLIAIAEPRLARPVDQQRHHDRDEQRGEIFLEQRTPRASGCRRVEGAHSTTSSACSRIVSGIVKPIAFAVFRLTAN